MAAGWGVVGTKRLRCGPGVRRALRGRNGMRVDAIRQGASEAQGWSESGSVPPSVGSHGTSVSMGPLMPPS